MNYQDSKSRHKKGMNTYQESTQDDRKKPKMETTKGSCWNGLIQLASTITGIKYFQIYLSYGGIVILRRQVFDIFDLPPILQIILLHREGY